MLTYTRFELERLSTEKSLEAECIHEWGHDMFAAVEFYRDGELIPSLEVPDTKGQDYAHRWFPYNANEPETFYRYLELLLGLFDTVRRQSDPNLHLVFETRRNLHNTISFLGRHGIQLSSTPFNPKRYKDAAEREECDKECLGHRRIITSMGINELFGKARRLFGKQILYEENPFDYSQLDQYKEPPPPFKRDR